MEAMKIGKSGIALIKHFESLHDGDLSKIGLQPKLDCSDIVTIGWGHALTDTNGAWLKGKDGLNKVKTLYPHYQDMTESDADALFICDLGKFEKQLNGLKLTLNQNQFDALLSFIFNCGLGNLKSSTLLKRIKSNSGDIRGAFAMWNKSGGVVLKGLILRRSAEANLFLSK